MAETIDLQKRQVNVTSLESLLAKANVPTLPLVAQKLVSMCSDDSLTFAQLATVIECDAGLASRLLRVANSAYYGLRHKVSTLDRAIGTLGLKHVKTIALGFQLAKTLHALGGAGFDLTEFWRHSLLRAVLARQLARIYCPGRSEEAFLIGLLQDGGILFLADGLGESYGQMWSQNRSSPASLYKLEKQVFQFDHITAAAAITKQWGLPDILSQPICGHHRRSQSQPSLDEIVQLSQIAYFTGNMAFNNPQLLSVEDMTLPAFCQSAFGLDEAGLNKLLQDSQQEFLGVAQMFADILPQQMDAVELLQQAKNLLYDLSSDRTREVFNLDKEVRRLKSRNEHLAEQIEDIRQRAETDDLTGLAQRDPLLRYLNRACRKVQNGQGTLALMFMDVDNLRELNARHGRRASDALLQELARLLREMFADAGCVCRYSGDEFVVALTSLQLKQAVHLATSVAYRVRDIKLPQMTGPDAAGPKFTCSMGLVFCEAGAQPKDSFDLLDLAEKEMQQVKQESKDGLRYVVLKARKNAVM